MPIEADLSDILGFIYPEPKTTKTEVKEEDLITALKGLTPNKISGLKKSPTGSLKHVGSN